MPPSENTKHLIIMLNELATINNDRMEGYKNAEKQLSANQNLSSVLRDKWQQSVVFITELQQRIKLLGGDFTDDAGFFNTWIIRKNTLTRNSTSSVLDECELGEDAAIKAYSIVLQSEVEIPAGIRQLIVEQQTSIKKSYDLIKKYRSLNLDFQNYNERFLL